MSCADQVTGFMESQKQKSPFFLTESPQKEKFRLFGLFVGAPSKSLCVAISLFYDA